MLEKVIIKNNELSDGAKKIGVVFQAENLLTRVIRSLTNILTDKNLTSVKNDITKELNSYEKGNNSKHNDGHFATTLILPEKPIALFNQGLGFLHNAKGLEVKRFCLSDAADDNGVINKDLVKTTNDYNTFVAQVKGTEPDHRGYCSYNEVQVYLEKNSLIGIFVSINKASDSEEEQKNQNIAAYLSALAINKLLSQEFNLNLMIYLYDQKQGKLSVATRNPDLKTLTLYLKVLNQASYSDFGLDTTDKEKLIVANERICSRLNMCISREEFNNLIKKSLLASIEADRKDEVESFNAELQNKYFPSSDVFLRYSNSNSCYELIIYNRRLSSINVNRINEMIKLLELNGVQKIVKDNKEQYYTIRFAEQDKVSKVKKYFHYEEDIQLYKKAQQEHATTTNSF